MPRRDIRDVAQTLRDIEDRLAPRLRFSPMERAVYYHLLRHTRLEGRVRMRTPMTWLAAGSGISMHGARKAVRSLAEKGAVKIFKRNRQGHIVCVRLPEDVPECRDGWRKVPKADIEKIDFMKDRALRGAIHRREGGRCFYCLRRVHYYTRTLDHVFPRSQTELQGGKRWHTSSYRNLVSCCADCNYQKRDRPAADFLRLLHRYGRLNAAELADRLAAVKALAQGRLKPPMD